MKDYCLVYVLGEQFLLSLLISSTSLAHERCASIINLSDFVVTLLVHSASSSIVKYLIFNNFESNFLVIGLTW